MKRSSVRIAAAGLLSLAATACGAAARAPEAPGAAARAPEAPGAHPGAHGGAAHHPAPAVASARAESRHTEADVRFMRHMIAHHAQALAMSSLAPSRSGRADVRLLAERIQVSQADEIAMMERWLKERGEEVPGAHAHHGDHGSGGDALMPGMLSAEELARLAAATGAEFDRLFLEYMIRHHEGALVMVRELFATPGAGQEVDIFRLASDVDADQRMEITRMRRVLDTLSAGASPR